MSRPIFRPAEGSRIRKADAQALGEVMIELRKADDLTPKALVAAARPASSPIHHLYPWNNKEAAEKYRLGLAAQHLRSVKIVIRKDDKGKDVAVRFAYVREGKDLPYLTLGDLARDHDLAQEIADQLYDASLEMLSVYRTYCHQFRARLKPFVPVIKSIERLTQGVA